MSRERQATFWLGVVAALALGLWLLRGILLPFVLGMAVGFLLDPLVTRLAARGLSRTWAASVLVVAAYALGLLGTVLLLPVLVDEARQLAGRLPGWAAAAVDALEPTTIGFRRVGGGRVAVPVEAVLRRVGELAGDLAGQLVTHGLAVANLLGLLAVTPLVAFYLLRDWPRLVAAVDDALPRAHVATIRALARECDRVLARFVRGQALVCLALAAFYAAGLTLIGLDGGLVIGLVAGVVSLVPYAGTALGLVASVGQAVAQAWPALGLPMLAFGVFVVGQLLADYVLTPRLVGERVGLHPLWVIFAVFAGGALFGVVGMLIAVPATAVIAVLLRFALGAYKRSALYGDPAGAEPSGPRPSPGRLVMPRPDDVDGP